MNILLHFLRTFLCLSSCVVGPDDAAEPTRIGKTKNHRVWEKFSWPTSFLVLGATTLRAPSLRAEEPKQLNMLYVGVESNIDSVRDGAKRYEEKTGVHINIDSYPQTEWRERMFTEIAAKSPHGSRPASCLS